jgi:hypothetical protein
MKAKKHFFNIEQAFEFLDKKDIAIAIHKGYMLLVENPETEEEKCTKITKEEVINLAEQLQEEDDKKVDNYLHEGYDRTRDDDTEKFMEGK